MNASLRRQGNGVFAGGAGRNCSTSAAEPAELTVVELVRRCLSGNDEIAWGEFVHRFQPLIACVITKTLRRWTYPQPSLIDDLVQETYLKLFADNFKALRRFEFLHDNAFLGYLKVVASNVVQDHCRSRFCLKRGSGKAEEDLETFSASVPAREDFSSKARNKVLVSQLRKYLIQASADPQFNRNYAIFWLYFEEGLTAKAIARLPEIGLSTKGVESALVRLTRLVREAVNKPPLSPA